MKKADKGHEGQIKGQRMDYTDFHDFLVFLESLDVVY